MRSVNPRKRDRQACRESYRLSTYSHFPDYVPVSAVGLAKSGFYFTGHRDDVVCFSCDMKVGDWVYYDDVHSDKWHKSNCQFKKEINCGNIPMDSTHFPQPTESNEPSCQIDSIIQYSTPVNPQMENEDTRLRTFRLESWIFKLRWYLHASCPPERIAAAGFYYTEVGDCVRCWYCDGGLNRWEAGDDPWLYHAKHFPTCEFLLRRMGPDFVRYAPSVLNNLHRTVNRSPRVAIPTRPRHAVPREAYPVAPSSQQPEVVNSAVESRGGRSEVSDSSGSELIKKSVETKQHHKLAVKSQREQQMVRHECREVFRLSSFFSFPPDAPVSPVLLATSGFFYAQQQVRCFSCGYKVENWRTGVVQLARCHQATCPFNNGEECGNILMALSPAISQCGSSTSLLEQKRLKFIVFKLDADEKQN